MNNKRTHLFLAFIVGIIVIGSATLEDWYGRTYYAQDALGYLDSYRALDRGDWYVALTPQWSIGYPLILSAICWIFPSGPEGEWTAIHVVNLVIFLVTYLGFLYFIKVATTYTAWTNGAQSKVPEESPNGFIFIFSTSIFLLWQVIIGDVSRVSPDLSISCVFFLVTASCLNFFMRPSVKTALILGFLMGLGYVLKAGFLPASAFTLSIVVLHGLIYSSANRWSVLTKLACALPVIALLALPYALALSKAVGKFTFGESGSLNYAWHVNNLPSDCNWQGGPARFGTPIHPTHLVLKNPPVFTFAEPFSVTYPPWYNIPYFYEGYHQFFSIVNQKIASRDNTLQFCQFFFGEEHTARRAVITGLLLVLGLILLKERWVWLRRVAASWPLYLLILGPIVIYLLVHIEPRYVIGPMIALLVVPLLPLFVPTPLLSSRVSYVLTILLAIGCASIMVANRTDALDRACHLQTYMADPAWKLGLYLHRMGVQPGDRVAAVGPGSSLDDTWAYVCRAHIVAELGNWAFDPGGQEKDLKLFADNPDVQETVFNAFRQVGAVVVVGRDFKEPPHGSGWVPVPETKYWVHLL